MREFTATGSGAGQRVEHHATIPEFEPGRHRWCAIIAFAVEEAEIAEGHGNLTADRIISGPDVGCIHCEQPYTPETAAQPCPGEPTDPQ